MRKLIRKALSFSLLLLLLWLICPAGSANAAMIRVKGELKSPTSYKLTLKKKKKVTHWRIRMEKTLPDGRIKYKKIKVLKASKRSYTIKNLTKDTDYRFEICGCVKKGGKLKPVIYEYANCFTGMSNVGWDDYAASDAPCSPKAITLWGNCQDDGFSASGLEFYRRSDGSDVWELIIRTDDLTLNYEDTNVESGKKYYYRFRSFGTYNGETLYSPFSDELCRSAVNQTGTFTSSVISRDKNTLILKLDSHADNGVLSINAAYDLQLGKDTDQETDTEGISIWISGTSADGKTWVNLNKEDNVIINGGESRYLRMEALAKDADLNKGTKIESSDVVYNHLPSIFSIGLNDTGYASMNSEMIH